MNDNSLTSDVTATSCDEHNDGDLLLIELFPKKQNDNKNDGNEKRTQWCDDGIMYCGNFSLNDAT